MNGVYGFRSDKDRGSTPLGLAGPEKHVHGVVRHQSVPAECGLTQNRSSEKTLVFPDAPDGCTSLSGQIVSLIVS